MKIIKKKACKCFDMEKIVDSQTAENGGKTLGTKSKWELKSFVPKFVKKSYSL